VRRYILEHAPPIYDPFCGGGSIPLEAQRLGLRAYGTDVNPVAVMISKALVEFPPKFAGLPPVNPEARKKLANGGTWNAKGAQGLAEDVRYYGRWMRDEAQKRIGHLYPNVELPDGSKATVIAWLWARTVASPNPAARGAHVPLVSSFMLATKPGKEAWVEPVLDPTARDGYRFEIRTGKISENEITRRKTGTKAGGSANFRCLLTDTIVKRAHIVAKGKAGRMGARLMAIVAEGQSGRVYLPPDGEHERIAASAKPVWAPETDLPEKALGFRVQEYGITRHRDLFTPRQLVALTTFSDLVLDAREGALKDCHAAGMNSDRISLLDSGRSAQAYADAVAIYLAFALDKMTDTNSVLCSWQVDPPRLRATFGRQALPMIWDYAEADPFGDAAGDYKRCVDSLAEVLDKLCSTIWVPILRRSAMQPMLYNTVILSTDPPYYDNVSYADLSDYFYIWERKSLGDVVRREFATLLVPDKLQELVADPFRHAGRDEAELFFLAGMSRAIRNMADVDLGDAPLAIYYAFKQAEIEREGIASTGWATFLGAVVNSDFQVDGTWPIRTELPTRNRGRGSNALASSIVLACRKRAKDAPSVTRGEFLRALRAELPNALHTLQESAIAPVDMAQASIGPGMAVFSRYKEVLEANDSRMSVREALRIINAELDAYLAKQEGDYDSWTRFAVTWFQQHGFDPGPFGDANTIATGKDVSVQGVVDAGILEAKAGKVRLLRRDELPDGYLPFRDSRQTIWQGCQHLIKRLESQGEEGAARLSKQLGYQADMARDLAYRLYQICERNKWPEEARAYNGLVESWREIIKIRDTLPDETTPGLREPELPFTA
jgi:putative DNA methylase